MDDLIKELEAEQARAESEADAEFAAGNPGEDETVRSVYKYFEFEGCDNLIYTAGYMEGIAFALMKLKKGGEKNA